MVNPRHAPISGLIWRLGVTVNRKKAKVQIDKRYPLREAAEALRYYGEGHVQGKIVITVIE